MRVFGNGAVIAATDCCTSCALGCQGNNHGIRTNYSYAMSVRAVNRSQPSGGCCFVGAQVPRCLEFAAAKAKLRGMCGKVQMLVGDSHYGHWTGHAFTARWSGAGRNGTQA